MYKDEICDNNNINEGTQRCTGAGCILLRLSCYYPNYKFKVLIVIPQETTKTVTKNIQKRIKVIYD